MNAPTRHSLIAATVTSGFSVMDKSASASPEQNEILENAWPDANREPLTKRATLARILATGLMVEEAAASAG